MEKKVQDYIKTNHLLAPGEPVLVALSGGSDSVALLRLLLNLGYSCTAAHCNFNLRDEESLRDEQFVRALCQKYQVPCRVISFDTFQYAQEHSVSIEMAARDLRYDFFFRLLDELNMTKVAVAHHQADQVETVLMHLLRGSGIRGLRGMKPVNGRIIRPMLSCSKAEIESYLKQIGQDFVLDSSNLTDEPLRNTIRHRVLPLLEELNPQALPAIFQSSVYLAQAESLMDEALEDKLKQICDNNNCCPFAVLEAPYASLLLHEWLSPYGFNASQMEQIIASASERNTGKRFESQTHTVWVEREGIVCSSKTTDLELPVLEMKSFTVDEISIIHDSSMAFLDADKLDMPLQHRKVETGDKFKPLGMKGHKLVSDFLTDRKITNHDKQIQSVVVDHSGHIVWLVGQRIDDRFKCTEKTKNIVRININKNI